MKTLRTLQGAMAVIFAITASASAQNADSIFNADPAQPYVLIRSKADTVLLVQEGDVENVLSGIGKKIDMTRRRGYGGAGGPTPGLMLMDMGPIQDIVTRDSQFKLKGFEIPRFQLTTAGGGMGYGGIGNGIRIGGGGFSGTHEYISHYTRNGNDSVAIIDVDFNYGGFLIEKCIVRQKANIIIGGMMGGGSYNISGAADDAKSVSAFSNTAKELAGNDISGMTLSMYAGATYTLISWFHLGGDATLTGFFGKAKGEIAIATGKTNYMAITPSLRIRFIFGNLG